MRETARDKEGLVVIHAGIVRGGRSLTIFSFMIALLSSGCGSVRPAAPDQRGAVQFERATTAYIEGRFVDAQRDFEDYSHAYPRAHKAAAAIYWDGMSLLALQRTSKARRRFQQAAQQTKDKQIEAQAMFGEARTLFLDGRLQAAEALYGRLRRDHRNEVDGADILAALADIRLKQGDATGAQAYIGELRRRFPGHPYLSRYAVRKHKDTLFTVRVGAFERLSGAQRQQARLRERGFDSFVTTRSQHGRVLHFVQAGAFVTRAAADSLSRRLRTAGFSVSVKG